MKYTKNCPLEAVESEIFHNWMVVNGLKGGHIPNETRTPYWGELAKQKKMGVSRGLCDHVCIIPAKKCKLGYAILIFVEMKRQSGTTCQIKPEQKEWINALNEVENVEAIVSYGAQQAIDFISNLLI